MAGRIIELAVELTTDASGDAVVTTRKVTGKVRRVAVEYGTLEGTTTVDITEDSPAAPAVLSLSASNTDAVYPNIKQGVTNTSGAAIASTYGDIYLADVGLTVTVASGGNAKTGTVYIQVEEPGSVVD